MSQQIENLKSRVRTYEHYLDKMETTADYISRSIKNIKSILETQKSCYVIDDVPGGSNTLSHLLEEESSVYDDIVDDAIPSVKSKIRDLKSRIRQLEEEEKEQEESD